MFGIGSKKKEVTVEKAGSLHLMIDDNEKLTITELTINGEINGTDLLLLREMAGYTVSGRHPNGALKRLDLKNAKFVPGGQAYAKSADGDCFIEEEDMIPVRAFRKCANLQVVILPESTKKIGGHAFERCVKLSSINMPEGLLTIGSRAFRKCYEIKSITIPSTVQTIEREIQSHQGGINACGHCNCISTPIDIIKKQRNNHFPLFFFDIYIRSGVRLSSYCHTKTLS